MERCRWWVVEVMMMIHDCTVNLPDTISVRFMTQLALKYVLNRYWCVFKHFLPCNHLTIFENLDIENIWVHRSKWMYFLSNFRTDIGNLRSIWTVLLFRTDTLKAFRPMGFTLTVERWKFTAFSNQCFGQRVLHVLALEGVAYSDSDKPELKRLHLFCKPSILVDFRFLAPVPTWV